VKGDGSSPTVQRSWTDGRLCLWIINRSLIVIEEELVMKSASYVRFHHAFIPYVRVQYSVHTKGKAI
jgi:hypothetical protein